ncbi:MAG: CDP-glucose 4,6-dehydratase [Planctomycetaceae bacterium]|jgi:CDP-glucose 4,6-dehydratase|nr:CDP-glucose 4,6-dehydratase [Planctomycetaceae bacterium]
MNFDNIYNGCRVFVTGHTGFKGAWLVARLAGLGAAVCGYSSGLPSEPAHFSLLGDTVNNDVRGDINNFELLHKTLHDFQPDLVFHLAAQPLVLPSYNKPLDTFATNIIGSANLLEACRLTTSVRAVIVTTTDKCYTNNEWCWGYRENDRIGGYEPYSASKACVEIVAASYRRMSESGRILIATCRAGNIIGGGDWADGRLVPSMIRAAVSGGETLLWMPDAVRPWLYVLDSLRGYLMLGQRLLEGKREFAEAWNFGPRADDCVSVRKLTELAAGCWNKISYKIVPDCKHHEASMLMLDCNKSRQHLNWKPQFTLEQGIEQTIAWYRSYYQSGKILTFEQIDEFEW